MLTPRSLVVSTSMVVVAVVFGAMEVVAVVFVVMAVMAVVLAAMVAVMLAAMVEVVLAAMVEVVLVVPEASDSSSTIPTSGGRVVNGWVPVAVADLVGEAVLAT